MTDSSESYVFRDFEYGEVVSTRYYDDVFPNELSEMYNLDNNLHPVVNDQGDDDPSNDITTQTTDLERLLSLSHPDDGVPAIFERRITINGSVEVDNILATQKVITIPGSYNKGSGIADYTEEHQINASVIEVIPELGVCYDNTEGYNPNLIEDYKYLYYDDDGDGVYNIIFVTDSEGYTGAIGLDYDGNSYFEPFKLQIVEMHIIESTTSATGKSKELERVLLAYGSDEWVNFRDYDNFDGMIVEPTFRDSLFDVWKMDYSFESSKLIELTKKVSYDRFIKLLTPQKIVGDIAFQVAAQLAAYVTGKVVGIGVVAAFSAAGSAVPGLGTAIGFVVGMLTYWLINSLNQIEQTKKRNNYIASQTTYNENYDGDMTLLSERWWKDEYFSETMTHTLQGTKGGVYSEVKAETDKYIYTGQVILAPPGVEKTTNFGTTIKNIVLDYSQQTRSYLAYSDWGERLNPFFYQVFGFDLGYSTIYATDPRDHRVKFMRNSIMYLEDQIYAETSSNEDKSYDRIIPYMMSIKPSLQFVDSDSVIAPEFYLNYPIYVNHEEYIADHGDGKLLKDEFYHIYKVYDTTDEGTIQLIPEEYITNRPLMSDIVKIEAWLVDTLGNEQPLGDVVSRHEYNNITGEVTFTFDEYLNFNTKIIRAKEDNKGINGYDAYIVLEFCIEKYRDITVERDDITSEEAQRIATMQSAHQSILEYTYQFTIAERTQERLNEIAYTTFVTITSTLIVMVATWGLNKAFAGFEANVYANAASKSLDKFGAASKAYQKIQSMAQQALIKSGRSLAFNMFKVTCAVITETLEELYVDPMIEAYVTNKVADMGWSETSQILLSGLAESGREQFLSSVTSFMREGFGGRTQVDANIQPAATNIPNAIENNLENRLATQEANTRQQLRQEYLKQGISTILMFAGAMAGGFGGSIGTALGNIMMVAGTSVEGIDSIKDMFEAVLKKKPVQTQRVDILGPQLISSLQAYVAANNWISEDLSEVIEWAQLDQPQKPVATPGMIKEIAKMYPNGFYGFIDPRLGAFNYFYDLGYDTAEIGVYAGGKSSNSKLPWEIVNYYFEKISFCRRSVDSSIIRHNYIPSKLSSNSVKLVCKHCGHELINDDISGLSKLRRAKLWQDDQNKNPGDITIYLIYWKKSSDDNWLPFPGLFYPGLTKKTVNERVYGSGGHFYKAFNNPKTAIEYTIRKYGLDPQRAQRLFRVEVLQIVNYQGTKESTQKLANTIEKFWIGFFHSQFYEFGRNIESGGSAVYSSIIIPFDSLDKVLYEASTLPRVGDVRRKSYVYNKLGMKETQNRILDNSIEFWYGFTTNRFENVIRLKRFSIIKNLFEQGYRVAYIANEINADRHTIVKWIEEDVYKDKYSGVNYKEIRKVVLSEKIKEYVSEGYTTPELLLSVLPGFENCEAIKHFVRQNLGGWNNLIDNFGLKENYWLIAKNLLEQRQREVELGTSSDYTAIEFAQALGSSTVHTSAAIKFIRRKLDTDMTWLEIRNFILTNKLPE